VSSFCSNFDAACAHTNSICSAPDASNDKSKNEQIKFMLRIIGRIASKIDINECNILVCPCLVRLLQTCGENKNRHFSNFIRVFFCFFVLQRSSVSYCVLRHIFIGVDDITLRIIYRCIFIQLSIVHILIKWIPICIKDEMIGLFQSLSVVHVACALYKKNIDNNILLIRWMGKCRCILF
jgi:hypothetical protein